MEIKAIKSKSRKMREAREEKILSYYENHMRAGSDSMGVILEIMKRHGYAAPSTVYRLLDRARARREQNG